MSVRNKGTDKAFEKKYELKKKLGAGQYADVFLGELKDNPKQVYAVKRMKKAKITSKEEIEGLELEIKILFELEHPGIIRLYEVFESKKNWYLVTELASGGELFERIVAKTKNGTYNEKEAAFIVMQIAECLKYCHERNIVHRDLKPENLLLQDKSDDPKVKLADFGFAAYCSKPLDDGCGTLIYVAPEVLKGTPYKTEPDMWSLGVISFIILCGYPPFFHTSEAELGKKIIRGRFRFGKEWENISIEAKEFIRRLLKKDPAERMTAADVLNDPWITNLDNLSSAALNINKELRAFNAKMLLKKAALALQALDKLQALLRGFDENEVQPDEHSDDEGA